MKYSNEDSRSTTLPHTCNLTFLLYHTHHHSRHTFLQMKFELNKEEISKVHFIQKRSFAILNVFVNIHGV